MNVKDVYFLIAGESALVGMSSVQRWNTENETEWEGCDCDG